MMDQQDSQLQEGMQLARNSDLHRPRRIHCEEPR